jgi:hypothetical protein
VFLLSLLFNFGLEYAIRKVLENETGMELKGILQFLVFVDTIKIAQKLC